MHRPDDGTSDGRVPVGTSAESRKLCRHCGTAVKTDEWFPIASWTAPDGSVEIHPFCGDDCRDAWTERRAEPDGATD